MSNDDDILLKEAIGKLTKADESIDKLEKGYVEICSDDPKDRSPLKQEVCEVLTTAMKQLDENTGGLYNSLQILRARQEELLKGDNDGEHKTE